MKAAWHADLALTRERHLIQAYFKVCDILNPSLSEFFLSVLYNTFKTPCLQVLLYYNIKEDVLPHCLDTDDVLDP